MLALANIPSASVCVGKKNLLYLFTSVTGIFSLLLLIVATSTEFWLYTYKRQRDNGASITFLITIYSGLWKSCKQETPLPQNVNERSDWNRTWCKLAAALDRWIGSYVEHFLI
ncbi:hypothetical protein Ciccas_007240 [Cichlidogyrus casuarinus]|uniref:Uncharacterized protein n=1 Tax=Cichlidogyrus casuarinus TaxID=1844966 RepID=A0ABD2Q7F3_9PLAT